VQSCSNGGLVPRQVAFMSRKLAGDQYRHDAHNVEDLAFQMALFTWRTNLLGVPFELYSDHDSCSFSSRRSPPPSEFCSCVISWLNVTSKKSNTCLARTTWRQISSLAHGMVPRPSLRFTCWFALPPHDSPTCTLCSALDIRLR